MLAVLTRMSSQRTNEVFVDLIVAWFALGILFLLLPLFLRALSLIRQRRLIQKVARQPNLTLKQQQDEVLAGIRPRWARGAWDTFAGIWRDLYSQSDEKAAHPVRLIEFLSPDKVVPWYSNRRLTLVLPGTLVALGILGTFVGLYQGLPTNNVGQEVVTQLVFGLRTAFATSLWGIACSILFLVLDRSIFQLLCTQVRNTSEVAELVFPFLDIRVAQGRSQNVMVEIQANLQTLATDVVSAMSNTLMPSLSEALGTAITKSVVPAIHELKTVTSQLASSIKDMPAALGDFSRSFKEQFTESMQSQFSELSQNLAQTVENQSLWQEQIERFSEKLAEQGRFQERLVDQIIAAAAALESLLSSLGGISGELTKSSSSLSVASATLSTALGLVNERMQQLLDIQQSMMQELRSELNQLTQARTDILSGWQRIANEAKSSIEVVHDAVNQLAEEVGDNLVHALGTFDNTLAEVIQRFSGTLSEARDTINELPATISSLSETAKGFSAGFEALRTDLSQVLTGLSTHIDDASGRASDAAIGLRESVSLARDAAQDLERLVRETNELFQRQSAALSENHIRDIIVEALNKSHDHLERIHRSLGPIMSISGHLEQVQLTVAKMQTTLAPLLDGRLDALTSMVVPVEKAQKDISALNSTFQDISHQLTLNLEKQRSGGWWRRK